MQFRNLPAWMLATTLSTTPLYAGPPLTIDDPGILEPWQWEIIVAATTESTDGGDAYELPLLDVSLGLTENIQAAIAYPYVYSDPNGGGSDWDFGNLQANIKWRFWNSENLQLAFSPIYAFGVTRTNAEKGIGDNEDVLFLPVNFEYALSERWTLNGEVGYASIDDSGDEWGYGAAVGYGLNEAATLLFELAGSTDTDFEDDFLSARVGLDYGFTETMHGLFSVGTGLREPSGEDELDYDVFLGLQFFR